MFVYYTLFFDVLGSQSEPLEVQIHGLQQPQEHRGQGVGEVLSLFCAHFLTVVPLFLRRQAALAILLDVLWGVLEVSWRRLGAQFRSSLHGPAERFSIHDVLVPIRWQRGRRTPPKWALKAFNPPHMGWRNIRY